MSLETQKEGRATSSHPRHAAETPTVTCPHHACANVTVHPASPVALAPDDAHLCAGHPVASTTAGYPHDSIRIRSCTFMASHCLCACTYTHFCVCSCTCLCTCSCTCPTIPPGFPAVPSWPAFTFRVPRTRTFGCSHTHARTAYHSGLDH